MSAIFGECEELTIDEECEKLRSGKARFSTPAEDCIFFICASLVCAVGVGIICLIYHFWPVIRLWWR